MNFDFLNDLGESLLPVETKKRVAASKVPVNGIMRVTKKQIVFGDEFRASVGTKMIDMVFSTEWSQYPTGKPKVLFCVVLLNEEKPLKADIKKEGPTQYAAELLGKLINFFDLPEDTKSVELDWSPENAVFVKKARFSKIVQRGEEKGLPTYVTRDNAHMNPVFVVANAEEVLEDDIELEDLRNTPEVDTDIVEEDAIPQKKK
jgi:hypothetical protein